MTHAEPSSKLNFDDGSKSADSLENDLEIGDIELEKKPAKKTKDSKLGKRFIIGAVLIAMGIIAILTSGMFISSEEIPKISTSNSKAVNNGKLVYAVGSITSEDFSDPMFSISANGTYLERVVEMYQWVEKDGGFEKEWKKELVDVSSEEAKSKGIANPPEMPFFSEKWEVEEIKIGNFSLSSGLLKDIDIPEKRPLTQSDFNKLNEHGQKAFKIYEEKYFFGIDPKNPRVGDLMVSFQILNPGTVTVLAKQMGSTLTEHITDNGAIAKILPGEHDIKSISKGVEIESNSLTSWIIRAISLLIIILGIATILGKFTKKEQSDNLDDLIRAAEKTPQENSQEDLEPEKELATADDTFNDDIIAEEEYNKTDETQAESESAIAPDVSTPLEYEPSSTNANSDQEIATNKPTEEEASDLPPPPASIEEDEENNNSETEEDMSLYTPEPDAYNEDAIPEGVEIIPEEAEEDEPEDTTTSDFETPKGEGDEEVVDISSNTEQPDEPLIPWEGGEEDEPPTINSESSEAFDESYTAPDELGDSPLTEEDEEEDDDIFPEGIEIISDEEAFEENDKTTTEETQSSQEGIEDSENHSNDLNETNAQGAPEPLDFDTVDEDETIEEVPLVEGTQSEETSEELHEPLDFNLDAEDDEDIETEEAEEETGDNEDLPEPLEFNPDEDEKIGENEKEVKEVPPLPRPPILSKTMESEEESADQVLAEAESFIENDNDYEDEENSDEIPEIPGEFEPEESDAEEFAPISPDDANESDDFEPTTEETEDSPFDIPNIPDDFDPSADMLGIDDDNEEIEFNPEDIADISPLKDNEDEEK